MCTSFRNGGGKSAADALPEGVSAASAPAVVDKGKGKRTASDAELEEAANAKKEREDAAKDDADDDDDDSDDDDEEEEGDDDDDDEVRVSCSSLRYSDLFLCKLQKGIESVCARVWTRTLIYSLFLFSSYVNTRKKKTTSRRSTLPRFARVGRAA